ncbi:unnamed protein product [Bursaphelenchus xylophilus]|uniref:(pine wood nematode) hypothetical protein n=1 Tax=Bursaphelenchus xylophilus TaxID=6326 RepID=A0A7I8WHH9_BURXY|nr:unnamed protein product [Bursaphelenchus xylophilus]CAG9109689.1 unnamed protein product [Bursaphelenchus xylophilus]
MDPFGWVHFFLIFLICLASEATECYGVKCLAKRSNKPSGTRSVGKSCTFTTDCVTGAFCDNRYCRCWSSYVHIEEFCWKRINPEESGCTYDAQCEAVWPGAKCASSGVCKCADGEVTVPTREGLACHVAGECPTNGANAVLFNRNSNRKAECYFFDRHGQELPGHFMGSYTCIQPQDGGQLANGTKPTKRWFYNSATSTCRQFTYGGLNGNSNNFLTKQHCESYCLSRCPRGQPLLDDNKTVEIKTKKDLIVTCQSNEDCRSDKFKCTKVQLTHLCCPAAEYICSEYGGLGGVFADLSRKPLQIPYNSGTNRFGQDPVPRWHWDRLSRKCRPFRYLGQGGNFNNFITEQDCLEFCSASLCPVGSPLRVESGGNVECQGDQQCPRSHYCINTVCCPTSVTVCNLPLVIGSACHSEPVTRYWYSPAQGTCQVFQYNGCGGNANNFLSIADCRETCSFEEEEPKCPHGDPIRLENGRIWKCNNTEDTNECPLNYECILEEKQSVCCPKKEYSCSIPRDSGRSCAPGNTTKWYFDVGLQSCRPFDYSGCDGNSNRFNSKRECEVYCGVVGCPHGGQVLLDPDKKPLICGPESANKCPQSHTCIQIANSTLDSLHSHFCCPTRFTVCAMKIDEGNVCGDPSIRFAFDPELRQCKPFMFKGCGGNENNFEAMQSCLSFCAAAACSAGEIIYKDKAEDPPLDCSRAPCPSGFVCVADLTNPEKSVCCGTLNMGVCPEGQGVFIDERSQTPQTCANDRSDCPFGYLCVFNERRNKFYCCAPNIYDQLKCPPGLDPAKSPTTDQIIGCSVDAQCIPGSKCHKSNGEHQSGLCCLTGPPCPPTFLLDVEQSRKLCNPLKSATCPDGISVCLYSDILERFVCCKRTHRPFKELGKCPGEMMRDSENRQCSQSELCPPSFNCIRRNFDRVGICCRHKNSINVVSYPMKCSNGGKPYRDAAGLNQICNDQIKCPEGYKCQLSESPGSKTRLCCLEPKKIISCPSNLLPLSADGVEQNCNQSQCPAGYKCNEGICCPTEEFACSVQFYAGVHCGNAKPQQRWYFHSATGRCQPFVYNGCTPSANNFADEKTCSRLCVESEASEVKRHCSYPLKDPKSGLIKECSDDNPECEEGQVCSHNAFSLMLCCEPPDQPEDPNNKTIKGNQPLCGPGYIPLIDAISEEPVHCHPFSRPCDKGQTCQYSAAFSGYLCCLLPDRKAVTKLSSRANKTSNRKAVKPMSRILPPKTFPLKFKPTRRVKSSTVMSIITSSRSSGSTVLSVHGNFVEPEEEEGISAMIIEEYLGDDEQE